MTTNFKGAVFVLSIAFLALMAISAGGPEARAWPIVKSFAAPWSQPILTSNDQG
jgi:hypothetical protein